VTIHEIETGRDVLANVLLLAGADPATMDELVRQLRPVHVDAGEVVVRAGEPGDRLYLVGRGRLRVVVESDEGPRVVRELGRGAALGELALLTGEVRSASVHAIRDSELYELDGEVFGALLERDAGFAIAVARALAQQLQASGGLAPPTARPSVIAVRALGADVDPAPFATELERALARFGSVELLGVNDAVGGYSRALDRAERDHAHVVLLDTGSDDDWRAFCSRQADRCILLAGQEEAPETEAIPPDSDLVVIEPVARDRLSRLLDAVAPRARHLADGVGAASVARVARRLVRRSLGVVLSGGGARGYAHIGAIESLREAGFEIDRVGGCSIGAFIGGMHAYGLGPDEMRESCQAELVRRSPFNDYTLPRVSLIRSRKAARMLDRIFGEAIVEELPVPFFTVSADLLASRTVVHRRGLVVEAVGASMSIPGLVPPLSRPGRLLVDGGVLNNLPVDVMAVDDEGPIVAVDVIRRGEASDESVAPGLPSIMETLSRATVLGSAERAEWNRRLADLVVTPDVQDIALREFSALERGVSAGRDAMRSALEAGAAAHLRDRLDAPL
jgi:NTE family protein